MHASSLGITDGQQQLHSLASFLPPALPFSFRVAASAAFLSVAGAGSPLRRLSPENIMPTSRAANDDPRSILSREQDFFAPGAFQAAALLSALDAASTETQTAAALSALASKVDALEPSEISALSDTARESGALAKICDQLAGEATHQNALAILANLTTVEVNPRAAAAKECMKQSNAIALVVRHLFSEYVQTAALACAVCQNVCVNDAEVVTTLHRSGGVGRLRELATCEVATIASAANGCLANLTQLWLTSDGLAPTAPRSWHRAATRLQVRAAAGQQHRTPARAFHLLSN